VLPIALGGLLYFGPGRPPTPRPSCCRCRWRGSTRWRWLAFIGGLSAATGMVIVEAIAVSTMVCNDLVMPLLLRTRRFGAPRRRRPDARCCWHPPHRHRGLLLLGWLYFRIAGEAYALVSIGLISFRRGGAVRAGAAGRHVLEGRHAQRRAGRAAAGFALWAYTLMLPSIAKSGWMDAGFLQHGPGAWRCCARRQLLGLAGWTT
jgi:Na+/proline symporter